MEHFTANKLFTNRQFGFLKGRSTVTQLLQILDEWTEALETCSRIDVIYIYTDFEKAFDKVPHKRLLSKLRSYRSLNVTPKTTAFNCMQSETNNKRLCLTFCTIEANY